MKPSDHFKETIKQHLIKTANEDPEFYKALSEKDNGKSLDSCINYIFTKVKEIGAQGYTDEEIFGLAVLYYKSKDLKKIDPIKLKVVVNHKPELSEEELEALKKQVREDAMNNERMRLHGTRTNAPAKQPEKVAEREQLSLI